MGTKLKTRQNHTAGDDSSESWTGHLKHSRFHDAHHHSHHESNESTVQGSPARVADEEEKSDSREIPTLPDAGEEGSAQKREDLYIW